MSNREKLSANQLAQKKAELKIRHKKQIESFDKDTDGQLVEAENDIMPSLDVKHANERLQLRERQLQELAGTMTDLMSKEELIQSYVEEANRAAENAKESRERATFNMAEKINQLKEGRRKKSKEQREQMDHELKKLEQELEEERERETLLLAERETEREYKKRLEMEEKEAKRNLELSQREMAEDDKQQLLREHQENMTKFQDNLHKEQERTKAALKEKLEARRRKRKESAMENQGAVPKESEPPAGQDIATTGHVVQERHVRESVSVKPNTLGSGVVDNQKYASPAQPSPVVTVGLPENMSENDWLSLLITSPVFERVNEIEELLKQGTSSVGQKGILGASQGRPYIDIKDAQWLCAGDLIPMDINDLSPANFVVYRFGVFLTQLLENRMNMPPITLLLASNLPANNYERNAFRNSFFYENSRQILFVREERLHSVGDFLIVIMHCLAHILVDDMVDDHNPLFLRAFYKAMQICCQDMFFARARATSAACTLVQDSGNGRTPLEKAFQHVATMTQRTNVVSELVDIKIKSITDIDYSPEVVRDRVLNQNSYMDKAKLKDYLSTLHSPSKATKQFASTRLRDIRGERGETLTQKSQRVPTKPRSHFKNPKDLLLAQINELQRQLDRKNSELVQVVTKQSQLQSTVTRLREENSKEKEEIVQQQLNGFATKKEFLLKKIAFIEEAILKKRKEAGIL